MPSTVAALGLGNLVGTARENRFTNSVDACETVLADASRLAVVLESTAFLTVFCATNVDFLIRRTLLLATLSDTRVARAADAFLVALMVTGQMATVTSRAGGLENLVLVAVLDPLTRLSDQSISGLANTDLLALRLTIDTGITFCANVLHDFVEVAGLDGLANLSDQRVPWFAHTNLLTVPVAGLVVASLAARTLDLDFL